MTQKRLRIGTRSSPLALIQADMVASCLLEQAIPYEIVHITTTADRIQNRKLAEIGGKALFTKELEEALYKQVIDIAVHSMKDVETELSPEFTIPCMLERADPRDALITRTGCLLADLPDQAVLGTASVRRAAQSLQIRPDLKVKLFRGNVATRLRKLQEGQAEATFLAMAGLKRLNQENIASEIMDPQIFVPAAGQGAIGIECRAEDTDTLEILKSFNHAPTFRCVMVERALLKGLGGSCNTPVGAYACEKEGLVTLYSMITTADGQHLQRESASGDYRAMLEHAQQMGERFHQWLSQTSPRDLC